jgi:hypothetical protein
MDSFRTTRMSGVDRVRKTRFSSHCTATARAEGADGSRRRAVPGQPGHCPREVTPGRSPSGRAVSGLDEPHQDPVSAWRLLVSSGSAGRGLTTTSITAASPGSAARSEARTPAHRFTPSGSGTSSSWTGSAPYPHAEMSISPRACLCTEWHTQSRLADFVRDRRAAFSIVLIGNQIG